MANLDNNVGINKVPQAYTLSVKKEEPQQKPEIKADEVQTVDSKTPQPAEIIGRSQVKKTEKPDTAQGVKEAMDVMTKNPELIAAAVKSGDTACDMLKAQGAKDAYEKACCGVGCAVDKQAAFK